MIFGPDLAALWPVATLGTKLSRASLKDVDVSASALALQNDSHALRVKGQLVYGLSSVLSHRAQFLAQDSVKANKSLINTFTQESHPRSSHVLSTEHTLDFDLDLGLDLPDIAAPAKLLPEPMTADSPPDISSDLPAGNLMLRDDVDALDDDAVPHSSTDLEILQNLDLADVSAESVPDFDISLDLSSEPLEAMTPPANDIAVEIVAEEVGGLPKKRKSRPRKNLAPMDENTLQPVAETPPPSILQTHARLQAEITPAGPALDPEFVRQEMKRRRLVGPDSPPEHVSSPEVGPTGYATPDSPVSSQFDRELPELTETYVAAESAIESEVRSAKHSLETALTSGVTNLQAIGGDKVQQAAAFSVLLGMVSKGTVTAKQTAAYQDISMQRI